MGISLNQMVNAIKKSKEYVDMNTLNLSSANFVSENGFGGLRIQDGKYQYYNKNTLSWVDIQYTDDNAYIGSLIPNPVTSLTVELDESTHNVKIKLVEPEDTVIDGSTTYSILGIKVVMKRGSEPETVDDGDLLLDLQRKDFGKYASEWHINTDILVMNTDTYYCKAFSYNEFGIYNNDGTVSSFSYTAPEVYGFTLDQSESDSDSMVTYFGNNELYTPMSIIWSGNGFKSFDYGDWKDVWFIKDCRPCMMKYDGTVDYYLNPDDYTKKEDGSDSDIANTSYEGNAMIEFPKIYIKYEVVDEEKVNISVSNTNVDDNYHCYPFIDSNGNEIDHTYMSIYDGNIIDTKLRSISGNTISYGSFEDFTTYGANNNTESSDIWSIGTFADYQMIMTLLMLVTRSGSISSKLGIPVQGTNNSNVTKFKEGQLNDKGLFYNTYKTGGCTKFFGMENFFGITSKHILGLVKDSENIQKVKMYKTDGGTDDYNLSGEGYHEIGVVPTSTKTTDSGELVDRMYISEYGLLPKTLGGSTSTRFRGRVYSANGAMPGAISHWGYYSPTFWGIIYVASTNKGLNSSGYLSFPSGARLSCKPLAKTTK